MRIVSWPCKRGDVSHFPKIRPRVGCEVESWKNTGLASGARSNRGKMRGLASGERSNLGEMRGLRRARGRISGKCEASHWARGRILEKCGILRQARGGIREKCGGYIGREAESWRNAVSRGRCAVESLENARPNLGGRASPINHFFLITMICVPPSGCTRSPICLPLSSNVGTKNG